MSVIFSKAKKGELGGGAPLSNKPTEADRCHRDEPCGKLRPPRQHGVISQEALKPFVRVDYCGKWHG